MIAMAGLDKQGPLRATYIFSFLSDPQHLLQCQATCRSWKSTVALARPRRLKLATSEGYNAPPRWLAKHSNLIQDVREVTFYICDGLTWEVWDIVLHAAPCLEVLISEVSHIRDLPDAPKMPAATRRVVFHGACWQFWGLEVTLGEAQLAILPRSLTFLCLRGDFNVTAEAWASVPSGIQLRTFELSDCTPEASASLLSPLPTCMASLTCLRLGAPDNPSLANIVVGCPMLQQLKLMFGWNQRVASWEPLTRLPLLHDLVIESGFDLVKARMLDPADLEALPTLDLDAFPALQNFSGQHCAGVKGHVRGAYLEIGYVQSISLPNIMLV